jgi:hypothetical protein
MSPGVERRDPRRSSILPLGAGAPGAAFPRRGWERWEGSLPITTEPVGWWALPEAGIDVDADIGKGQGRNFP